MFSMFSAIGSAEISVGGEETESGKEVALASPASITLTFREKMTNVPTGKTLVKILKRKGRMLEQTGSEQCRDPLLTHAEEGGAAGQGSATVSTQTYTTAICWPYLWGFWKWHLEHSFFYLTFHYQKEKHRPAKGRGNEPGAHCGGLTAVSLRPWVLASPVFSP